MKTKNLTKTIIAAVSLVLVLVAAFVVYNLALTSDEEAPRADIRIPYEFRQAKSNVDIADWSKLRWKTAITIRGWLLKENPGQDPRDMYLVLRSKNDTLIYQIKDANRQRPDVSKAMKMGGDLNTHGFALTIPAGDLEENVYQVGYVVEDKTGKYFVRGNTTLTIPSESGGALVVERSKLPKDISNQVAMTVQKGSRSMQYSIDKFEKGAGYLSVMGWSFLKGMDAGNARVYVALNKDKETFVFDTQMVPRPDVTKAFASEKVNLDQAGFRGSIALEDLPKGKYSLGVYLVNGAETGYTDTRKTVEIGD